MPGICHCSMHYSVHCMQSHITVTHSKGFPAKVANHLANMVKHLSALNCISQVFSQEPTEFRSDWSSSVSFLHLMGR